MLVLVVSFVGTAFLILIFGVLIKYKKCYSLISGYNTMPEEKKANVDTERLGKLVGNYMFFIAAIMFFSAAMFWFKIDTAALIALFMFVPSTAYILIKGQSYDHNKRGAGSKAMIVVVVALVVIVPVFIAGMMLSDINGEHKLTVDSLMVRIESSFGTRVELKDIKDIQLNESVPKIKTKVSGLGIQDIRRGKFTLEGMGTGRLYVHLEKKPFIYIYTEESYIIINFKDEGKTVEVFDEIKKALANR